ncbi:hypothetical protein [Paenibacillus sp. FSL R7-0273]
MTCSSCRTPLMRMNMRIPLYR